MILIDDILIADEVLTKQFVCNLNKCKGICCIEGDGGAPLEEAELAILEEIYPKVKPYLTKAGIDAITKQGLFVLEDDDEYTPYATPLINGGACAFVVYEKDGLISCGIEKAWKAKKIDFQKPISCHLYPLRIKNMETITAVNFDKWEICNDACKLGAQLQVPVYQFVKEALIRKFGKEVYEKLDFVAKDSK